MQKKTLPLSVKILTAARPPKAATKGTPNDAKKYDSENFRFKSDCAYKHVKQKNK